jgi:NADH-quinone oxidoreductase subunit H
MFDTPFWISYGLPVLHSGLWSLVIILPLLVAVAMLTYVERKVLSAVHLRRGPNVVGPFGLFQPLADGLKMLTKETIIPTTANRLLFLFAPILTFVLSLIAWAVMPFDQGVVLADINVGLLYLFAISSLSVYGIIIAGWASNSKYAFLGALRSAAQMVSYEVSIGFVLVSVLLSVGSLNLSDIVMAQKNLWFVVPHFPLLIIFFVSMLAETKRTPFDLPEGESELVAGYFVEYSALTFGLFFLAEYANMWLVSILAVLMFLGGWLPPVDIAPLNLIPGWIWLGIKTFMVVTMFLWVRSTFPRYRYDQIMRLGWKIFIPVTLVWLVVVGLWMQTPFNIWK